MNKSSIQFLTCPSTHHTLKLNARNNNVEIKTGILKNDENLKFSIKDGIADLTYPKSLLGSDKDFEKKYSRNAKFYDEGMRWLFSSFYEKEEIVRRKLVSFLKLKKNDFVLNVGCGTGSDSKYIAEKIGLGGKLFNLDLTENLLRIARQSLNESCFQEFFIGNASYLPFADKTFNSTFHFGGINEFTEKKRAIEEMVRVTKLGGRVVIGDESAAPWLAHKRFGQIIRNANPLYNHKPPLHLLPENAQDVSLTYLLGNSFYVIAFTVGKKTKLNIDLPIPGKRGGTLKSRFDER